MHTLDQAETSGLSLSDRSADPERVDLREIAQTGISIIAPLKVLSLGPLSVGFLAVLSATTPTWHRGPLIAQPGGQFAQPMKVPGVVTMAGAQDPLIVSRATKSERSAVGFPSLPLNRLMTEAGALNSNFTPIHVDVPPELQFDIDEVAQPLAPTSLEVR